MFIPIVIALCSVPSGFSEIPRRKQQAITTREELARMRLSRHKLEK